MRLISVRELGCERPWHITANTDPMTVWSIVGEIVEWHGRNPALQEVRLGEDGPWIPLIGEPDEAGILARMVARLNSKDAANARLDAVDDLIELGHTTPEAWNLVWEAMPVEAVDDMEAAE